MSKVITFSRFFPVGHARAKQPTYFVEQILSAVYRLPDGKFDEGRFLRDCSFVIVQECLAHLNQTPTSMVETLQHYSQKAHTIRNGDRWKAGDKFTPRFWSGKPYNSKQITICPDITIGQTIDFKIDGTLHNDQPMIAIECPIKFVGPQHQIDRIAQNDGLTTLDFINWFAPYLPFHGQIITFKPGIYEMV